MENKKGLATRLKNVFHKVFSGFKNERIQPDYITKSELVNGKKIEVRIETYFFEDYNKRLIKQLEGLGFDISKNTVIEHISYFEDAYLFFQNLKYEYSVSQQMGSIKKLYCVDNGILNAVSFKFSENIGKLLENLVFIELKRKNESVYRHKAKNDCDFLIVRKNKVSEAIQVTQKLDETTEKREIDGLIEALKEHKLNEGLILTEEQEGERTVEGKKIVIKPVWQWLLEK